MIDLTGDLDKEIESKIRSSAWAGNRSSALGWAFECPRYIELVRIDHRKLPPTDLGLQRIFDEGNKQERLVRQDLMQLGYTIKNPDKDEKWDHLQITGRIDGLLTERYGNRIDPAPILEIKSASPNNFRSLEGMHTQGDLRKARTHYHRGYFAQIQGYHLLYGKETGIILFKDKSSGRYHQIPTTIDWKFLDELMPILETVNENVAKKKPRPAVRCEACGWCGFAAVECFVGKDFGEGFQLLDDPELEAKLDTWYELYTKAKDWEKLDKRLKATFKQRPCVLGPYKITPKEIFKKKYVYPDEVKAKYQEESSYIKVSIEKL